MDKKIIIIMTIVAFVLNGANASFAVDEDGFHVQSLSVDNTKKQDNTTSINMSNKKFPKTIEEKKEPENTHILTPENTYPPNIPYGYNTNYIQYRKVIGPYYPTGFNRGFGFNYKGHGFNYKGHGYNYGYSPHNKRPIYVSPPPQPPSHHPMRPPSYGSHHHGHHHH